MSLGSYYYCQPRNRVQHNDHPTTSHSVRPLFWEAGLNNVTRFPSDANTHSSFCIKYKIMTVKPSAPPEEVKREFMLESQQKGDKQLLSFFLQQKYIKRYKMANRRAPSGHLHYFSYLRRPVQHLMINTRGEKLRLITGHGHTMSNHLVCHCRLHRNRLKVQNKKKIKSFQIQ